LVNAKSSKRSDFNPEATEFLIQSSSPEWIRRKISLSDLCVSAVILILEEANVNEPLCLILRKLPSVMITTQSLGRGRKGVG